MRRRPSIIRFGDSSAKDEEIVELGFMPTDEAIERRASMGTFKELERKCTLAMQAFVPKTSMPVEILVQGKSDKDDTLRIRFGKFMTPDMSLLSSSNLRSFKAVFDTFFDVLIENATRREKHADKLVGRKIDAESPLLQDDIQFTFFDYMKERVRLNRLERNRMDQNASSKHYKLKRFEVDQKMVDIYRKQGLIQNGNAQQGKH